MYVELQGSEKQVNWANQIRTQLTNIIERKNTDPELTQMRIADGWSQEFADLCDNYEMQVKAVNSHPDAKWWIDNRQRFTSLSFPEKIGFVAGMFTSPAEFKKACGK